MEAHRLTIHVTEEQGTTAVYRFCLPVVRIGRDPDCHLVISHEAVSRQLCSIWLEDGGKTIRVEERPGLTNSLRCNGRDVLGGVSGERLELFVGPMQLLLLTDQSQVAPESPGGGHRMRTPALALALAVLVGSFLWKGIHPSKNRAETLELPETPLCSAPPTACETPEICAERARLLMTRGAELAGRAVAAQDRVRAAEFYRDAALLYGQAKSSNALEVSHEAEKLAKSVVADYRRLVLAFHRAVRENHSQDATEAASSLLGFLWSCDEKVRSGLEELAAKGQQKGGSV